MEQNVTEQERTQIAELKEPQQTSPPNVEEKKPTFVERLVERFERWLEPMVMLTAIIMFATLLYAVFSFFLWKVTEESVRLTRESVELTRKSLEVSEKTFSRQYRPYIGVSNIEYQKGDDDEKDDSKKLYTLVVPIKNFGSIPAHNLTVKMQTIRDGMPQKVNTEYGMNNLTLFPQAEFKAYSSFSRAEPIDVLYAEPPLPEWYNKIEFEVSIDYQGMGEQMFQSYSKWEYIRYNDMGFWSVRQQTFK